MRLGELLVTEGLLATHQVEQALRGQVMWGGRLGTNLVELGLIDLDTLSRALGRQFGLAPAFARHFDNADPAVQRMVPAHVVEQYACIPLARLGDGDRVAIAVTAPLDGWAADIVAGHLEVTADKLVIAIAAELRIRYHLERDYQIPRPARFLRARKRGNSMLPSFEVDMSFDDDEVDIPIEVEKPARARATPPPIPPAPLVVTFKALPEPAPKATPPAPPTADRRRYVRTLAEDVAAPASPPPMPPPLPPAKLPPPGATAVPLARMTPTRPAAPVEPAAAPADTLAEAARTIRRATDRDALGPRVIDAITRFTPAKAAVVLVPRGDATTSWSGFRRSGEVLGEIAVPIDEPNLVPTVLDRRTLVRVARGKLGKIDRLLLDKLDGAADELAIAPIASGDHVWCVIALAVDPGAELDALDPIAEAAATAFVRLWRNANR